MRSQISPTRLAKVLVDRVLWLLGSCFLPLLSFVSGLNSLEITSRNDTRTWRRLTRRRSYSLPTDMKIELVSRLPAAAILRFRLLSRSFQSLLKSPSFEAAFYQRHHSEIKVGVLQTTEERNTLAYCICDGDSKEIILGPSTAGTNLSFVGTYRGMVALVACTPPNGRQSIILWNPTTRVHVCLPLQEKPYSCYLYGLCYDDKLGWSVVLARMKGRKMSSSITIIHLEFSSGRKIKSEQHGVFPICPIEDEGIVARGTPYWVKLAYKPRPVLLKYNGKEFEVIQLPQGLIDTKPSPHSEMYTGSLGLIHDDLCILTQRGTSDQFDLWTTQDCQKITSWSRTLTFFIGGSVAPKVGLQMIGKSGNKLVLTANEGRILVTFDLSTNNARTQDFGANGRCFGYKASLESPPMNSKAVSILGDDECFKAVERSRDRENFFLEYFPELEKKLACEEGVSILDSKDELAKLKKKVETIRAVLLVAEKKQESSAEVKNWIKRLKGLLCDFDDLFDEVASINLLKKQMMKGNNKHSL